MDAKGQQRIPWVETVDGNLDAALGAALDLAQVLVDHCRQFFGGLRLFDRIYGCRMLCYLVDGRRSAVFRGGLVGLAVSKKLKDRALCCDDDAGIGAFVFVGHFPFALSLNHFSGTDHVGARFNRVNDPTQFYGDNIGPDIRLCHPSKEGILLWCPPAAADFDHVKTISPSPSALQSLRPVQFSLREPAKLEPSP